MINQTFAWTALVSAFITALSLRFLQLFHFISWSPIGWAKKWQLFTTSHTLTKWLLLFVSLVLVYALVYLVVSFTTSIPPSITALLIGIVAVFAIEWSIESPKTPMSAIRSISIPFFTVMAIVLRFVTGTAVFMKKLSDEHTK